jgi:hypothetical protein
MPSLNSLMALLPSGAVSGPVGSSPIAAPALRSYLRSQPAYMSNRERAAVLIKEGLGYYEIWTTAKPILFVGGLVGMAVSGAALYRRRKSAKEAMVLYAVSFLISAGVAWVSKPGAAAATGQTGVVAELDEKRAELSKEDPGWADAVYQDLYQQPGIQPELDANPLVKAIVL